MSDARKSWRDHIEVHPAADLFPMMSDEELKALAEDIRKYGMKSPVTLWFDGERPVLLDGRNRLDAIERFTKISLFDENGINWESKHLNTNYMDQFASKSIDPYAYVVSANIHRRHLTNDQKRELIGKLLKADPTKSNRQIAEMTKSSHPTVATERAKLEAAGDVVKVSTSIDTKGRKQPAKKPKSVSIKPTAPLTPAQRVENMIRLAGIADKKKHGELSLDRVINEVVAAADRLELIQLAIHPAPERHIPARARCERDGIRWTPAPAKSAPALADKLEPLLEGLFVEGQKNMATMSPGTVAALAFKLERLLVEHGIIPESKRLKTQKQKHETGSAREGFGAASTAA